MRTKWILASFVVGAGGMVAQLGCGQLDPCSYGVCELHGQSGSGGSGPSTSASTGTTSSGGGGTGGTPVVCIPSEVSTPVDDSCGLFVSSSLGDDANEGTKDKPLKTLQHALDVAAGKPIYACAESFAEAVTVPAGSTMFGRLDCTAGWAYGSVKSEVAAAADAVPLLLSGGSGTTQITDFAAVAADAVAPGGSSIAMIVDGATAELERCDLVAGHGAAGAPGMTPAGAGQKGADAPAPNPLDALDGCIANKGVAVGGNPGQTMCGAIETSGGPGGNGQNFNSGGSGQDALPQPQPNAAPPVDGLGGAGQTGNACGAGHDGAPGAAGASGTGAIGFGAITGGGYSSPAATAGATEGTPGYGGGGGGGAHKCTDATQAGPAGGGGGAGGCGGAPGGPGQSGGASLGLISVSATVTLADVSITASDGGSGGVGADGQPGGAGGSPGAAGKGDALASACNGGKGGQGGRGGSGGGGLGGHSLGIAFKGSAPTATSGMVQHGSPGSGGLGGDGDATASGGDGLGCASLSFDDGTCTP